MIIIKIGGGEKINLEGIADNLKTLIDSGEKIVVVHGANKLRDSLAEKLNIKKTTIKSLSGHESVFSDKDMIDLVMISYSGLRNKRIIELCQQKGVNAIGLSGIDGKMILGERNKGIKTEKDGKAMILRDFSGKPKRVNLELLDFLLEKNYVPVLTVPIIDEKGFAINSENDDIVALLQKELKAEKIVHLIEAKGLLKNESDENSLIKKVSKNDLEEIEKNLQGRIKRKILALQKILQDKESNVKIFISDGRSQSPILDALNGEGTVVE